MLFVVGPESACLLVEVPSLVDWLSVLRRELIFDITLFRRYYSQVGRAIIPHVFRLFNERRIAAGAT